MRKLLVVVVVVVVVVVLGMECDLTDGVTGSGLVDPRGGGRESVVDMIYWERREQETKRANWIGSSLLCVCVSLSLLSTVVF